MWDLVILRQDSAPRWALSDHMPPGLLFSRVYSLKFTDLHDSVKLCKTLVSKLGYQARFVVYCALRKLYFLTGIVMHNIWRRSASWMVIKAILHYILVKECGEAGNLVYPSYHVHKR